MFRLYNYFFKPRAETPEEKKIRESLETYKCIRKDLIETAIILRDILNIRDFSEYSDNQLFALYKKYEIAHKDNFIYQRQIHSLKLSFDITKEDSEKYIEPFRGSSSKLLSRAVRDRQGGQTFMTELDIELSKRAPLITF